jgi:adenylate cyclase
LAADVVGYSKLMGEDQSRTLGALRRLRNDVFDPLVRDHNGKVIKSMGDGWIVEFASVGDGVNCAMAIQNGLLDNDLIRLRTGIHIGDVVFEAEDIFGDGVNIAARLEQLAEPGEVLISDTAHQSLDGKAARLFVDGGRQNLKNISRAVNVWRWQNKGAADGQGKPAIDDDTLTLPDKPSIAVLPFDNMSGDPEQEYFADGMSEDIITDLSKASGLFVIARNSSFAYKGKSPDIREVCRELGVKFVLEGSVRRAGNRIRINAQLIEGDNGSHLWGERYDREMADIFAVQDEVTQQIVAALKVELTDQERSRRENRHQADLQAYDFYIRGRGLITRFTPGDNADCQAMLKKAISIDPDFAEPYGALSVAICTDYLNGWNGANKEDLDTAWQLAERARQIDPDNAECLAAISLCQTWRRDLGAAVEAGERAISIDANLAVAYSALGQALDFSGRHERAVEMFLTAFRLDPHYDLTMHLAGRALMAAGQLDEAEKNFRRRLIHSPGSDVSRAYLAAVLGQQGSTGEAKQLWRELLEINPNYDPHRSRTILPYTGEAWFDQFFGGLKEAGIIE